MLPTLPGAVGRIFSAPHGAVVLIGGAEEQLGQQGVLRQTLEMWEAEPDRRKVSPLYMAVGYVQSGDRERALDWIESQYEQLPAGFVSI